MLVLLPRFLLAPPLLPFFALCSEALILTHSAPVLTLSFSPGLKLSDKPSGQLSGDPSGYTASDVLYGGSVGHVLGVGIGAPLGGAFHSISSTTHASLCDSAGPARHRRPLKSLLRDNSSEQGGEPAVECNAQTTIGCLESPSIRAR